MKQYITIEELKALDEGQQKNLRDLWKPKTYDLAYAKVLKDAENEEYDEYEFVVGNIGIDGYGRMYLFDLKALQDDNSSENEGEENELSDNECDEECEEEFEEEFDPTYFRPSHITIEEALPLLSVGNMIEILSKKNYPGYQFYINIEGASSYYESGKYPDNRSGLIDQNNEYELCDALWDCKKMLL